jgi:hypothetical protein
MASSFTTNKNLEKPAAGDYSGTWAPPLNANFDLIDKALAGTQTYSFGGSNIAATQVELQNLRIKATGTLSANVSLTVPNSISGHWIVDNATSGSFTLTVKQLSGDAGVTVTQGLRAIVVSDGTNCKYGNDIPSAAAPDLTPYMQKSNNLNDVASTSSARTNLGLADGAVTTVAVIRTIPQNAQTSGYTLVAGDAGKHISITTGGVTVNQSIHSINDAITIYNNSGSSQTITQGTSVTLRLAGTATTGNRTLAQYGICTILCVASNTFVISGAGLT